MFLLFLLLLLLRPSEISALQQVLIALRFYANESFLQVIGQIKWPKDRQEVGK